jgi:hypothetical protein
MDRRAEEAARELAAAKARAAEEERLSAAARAEAAQKEAVEKAARDEAEAQRRAKEEQELAAAAAAYKEKLMSKQKAGAGSGSGGGGFDDAEGDGGGASGAAKVVKEEDKVVELVDTRDAMAKAWKSKAALALYKLQHVEKANEAAGAASGAGANEAIVKSAQPVRACAAGPARPLCPRPPTVACVM